MVLAVGVPLGVVLWFGVGFLFRPSEVVRRAYDGLKTEAGAIAHPPGAKVAQSSGLIKSTWASWYLEVSGVGSFEAAKKHYVEELTKRGWRLVEEGTDVGDPKLEFARQGAGLRMVYRGKSGRLDINLREDVDG